MHEQQYTVHHWSSKRSCESALELGTHWLYTIVGLQSQRKKIGTIWESCLIKACEVCVRACIADVNAGIFDAPLAWVTAVGSESPPLTASTLQAASFCCSENSFILMQAIKGSVPSTILNRTWFSASCLKDLYPLQQVCPNDCHPQISLWLVVGKKCPDHTEVLAFLTYLQLKSELQDFTEKVDCTCMVSLLWYMGINLKNFFGFFLLLE